MDYETDSIEEITAIERTREQLLQVFEEAYMRANVAFQNIDDPSEQDADAFREKKVELRSQLCRDLLATIPTRENSRLVFYQNFYADILQEAYNGSRTASAAMESFQTRLRRANESQGLHPDEFDKLDHTQFMRSVMFVQNLLLMKTMMSGLGFSADVVNQVLSAEISHHYK